MSRDGKKTGGRPFVKGDPRAGRKKDPIETHLMKKMSYGEFITIVHKILQAKPEQIGTFNNSIAELAVASIMQHTIKHADPTRFAFILERLYGKVPEKLEVTAKDELTQLTDEQLLERAVHDIEQFQRTKLIKGSDNNE